METSVLNENTDKKEYKVDTVFGKFVLSVEKKEDYLLVNLSSSIINKEFKFDREELKIKIKEFLEWIG